MLLVFFSSIFSNNKANQKKNKSNFLVLAIRNEKLFVWLQEEEEKKRVLKGLTQNRNLVDISSILKHTAKWRKKEVEQSQSNTARIEREKKPYPLILFPLNL